jgi:glycosyltransferase involved in cell wall biosynthesis
VTPRPSVAWLGQRSTTSCDGLITYSREITRGLQERGMRVVFFHHEPELAGEGSIALRAVTAPRGFRIAAPGARRQLADLLRQGQVDLVHASLSFSSLDFELADLCHELGLPVVATVHAPFDTRQTMWGGLSRMLYRIYSVPLARFDRIIVFGDAQLELLAAMGVPRERLRVVPNGVDVERYSPGPSDRAQRLGARRLFLYMGRLDPEKNVQALIEAFGAADPPADVRLALAGSGSERRRLEARYGDRRLVFLGPLTDESERIALLRAAEAFFLPSSIEGLSLALLEAMACGVCPVATEVGVDGDAVRGAGIVLEPLRVDSELRLAMRLLVSAPGISRHLGHLARRRAVERYSLDRNLDTLLDIYSELAARTPAASTA